MKPLVLAFIRFYQASLSPLLPSSCRFYPTCSSFAYEAVEKWGAWRGTGMAFERILRCHPFGAFGYDPVPEREVPGFACQVPGNTPRRFT